MDYKYTPDGKKVVVIGSLNSKETIVQEVFIKDGTEFPAGEHFIVKSLLDSPAETYQERTKKNLEKDVQNLKETKKQIEKEISGFRIAQKAAASKIKWIEGITDPELVDIFDHIKSIVCGEYTHVVFDDYRGPEILEWNAELFSSEKGYGEGRHFDGIRLVSLFGRWPRDNRLELNWLVNQYRDGSGSSWNTFYPCKSYNEAINKVKEIIDSEDYLSDKLYEICKEYSIEINEEKNNERIKKKKESLLRLIEKNNANRIELEAKLNKIES
jgi:hypothetical protein